MHLVLLYSFSNLFTGPADRGGMVRSSHTMPHIRYSAPTNQVVPAPPLDTMRRRTLKSRHDFLDQGDTMWEKLINLYVYRAQSKLLCYYKVLWFMYLLIYLFISRIYLRTHEFPAGLFGKTNHRRFRSVVYFTEFYVNFILTLLFSLSLHDIYFSRFSSYVSYSL